MHPVDMMKGLVVKVNLYNVEEQKCMSCMRSVEYPVSLEIDEDHCIDNDMSHLMVLIEHAVHEFQQGRWTRVSEPSFKQILKPWFCSTWHTEMRAAP